jgi:hypothetical protein
MGETPAARYLHAQEIMTRNCESILLEHTVSDQRQIYPGIFLPPNGWRSALHPAFGDFDNGEIQQCPKLVARRAAAPGICAPADQHARLRGPGRGDERPGQRKRGQPLPAPEQLGVHYISVGHRTSILDYRDRVLELQGPDRWRGLPVDEYRAAAA